MWPTPEHASPQHRNSWNRNGQQGEYGVGQLRLLLRSRLPLSRYAMLCGGLRQSREECPICAQIRICHPERRRVPARFRIPGSPASADVAVAGVVERGRPESKDPVVDFGCSLLRVLSAAEGARGCRCCCLRRLLNAECRQPIFSPAYNFSRGDLICNEPPYNSW